MIATQGVYVFSHPAKEQLCQKELNYLLIGRDVVLSLWYNHIKDIFLFLFLKISWKVAKKIEKKMSIITCFGNQIRSSRFFFIVSDKDHW